MAFRRLSSVVVLVAAVLWAVGTHVCEAFPSKLTKGHIYHSQHSSLLSKVWTSHFTSTDSSLFLPHSVPRKPTAGTVLILTESTVKSATIRHLLMQYSPASFLSQQQFVLKTCPETITTLAKTIRSPRPTLKNSAELDFSVAIDAALNPAYELVQSKSTRDTLRDIQDTFREKNVTKLVVAFNMDREGDVLMWHLLSVLKVPENVTISRLRLSELTPNLFQKALTNALSPTTDDKVLFDMNFIDSQLVRRVVDRTISFVLAQALHKCLGCYYSVGRVQSSVLNHIVERENVINHAKLNPAYTLKSKFKMKLKDRQRRFPMWVSAYAELCAVNNRSVICPSIVALKENETMLDKAQVTHIAQLCDLPSTTFHLTSSGSSYAFEPPPKPLSTAALMELSIKYLHFSPHDTLLLAQSLYDKGFITYPITASSKFNASEYQVINKTATERFGAEHMAPHFDSNADGNVDAMLPTASIGPIRPAITSDSLISPVGTLLVDKERILFDFIMNNTLASVMLPARHQITESVIEASLPSGKGIPTRKINATKDHDPPITSCVFKSIKKTVIDPGYRIAFVPAHDSPDRYSAPYRPPDLTSLVGTQVSLSPMHVETVDARKRGTSMSQIFRKFSGVRRFTPTTLMVHLAKKGAIDPEITPLWTLKSLDLMEKRGYLMTNPSTNYTFGKKTYVNEGEIQPTRKGTFLTHYLTKYFHFLVHPFFASTLHDKFKAIENGSLDKERFMEMFIYGSNETQAGPLASFFKDGLFRSVSDHMKSKLLSEGSQTPSSTAATPVQPVRFQYLGQDPSTKQSVYICNGKFGPFLQIGGTKLRSRVKRFNLPFWLSTSIAATSLPDALTFATLPRTVCLHPSTNQPITLLVVKGALCLQLGSANNRDWASVISSRVPLDTGIFPSEVTEDMALDKFRLK